MSDVKTREQELLEEFKEGLDPNAAPQLAQRVAALEAERDAANARADKAEKASKAAKAKVSRGEAPAKPRAIGAMKEGEALTDTARDGNGDKVTALSDAIAKAEEAGKPIEIVFSDGKKELTQVPPAVLSGPVWVDRMQGKFLRDPVVIEGSGSASFQIRGYALLIDGKQVAYTERSDPINVAPGTKVTLQDDIYFQ